MEKKVTGMQNLAKDLHVMEGPMKAMKYNFFNHIPKAKSMVPKRYQPFVKAFELILHPVVTDVTRTEFQSINTMD